MRAGRFVAAAILCLAVAAPARAAGNVTLTADAGRLSLDGDDAANAFVISTGAVPGTVVIVGLDGTTVGGLPEATATGVGRLVIHTGDGADRVELRQLTVDGDVHLRLGRGEDTLVAEQVDVRTLDVGAGRGRDTVSVGPPARVRGLLHVRAGPDGDVVLVDGADVSHLSIAGGHGYDVVDLFDTFVHRRTQIFTNPGEDLASFTLCDFHGDVDVNLGDDDDVLYLDTVIFDEDSRLDGGDDDDVLFVAGPVGFDDDLDIDDFEFF